MKFLFAAALALLPAVAQAQSSAGGSSGGGGGGGGASGPYWTGQYNSTLPSFANGQTGYLTLDSNGRVIISPTTPLTISGSVTANIGTTNGLALDSTLQGVASSSAATSAAIGTKTDAATAAGADTSQVGALRAIRDKLLGTLNAALAAGTNIIGKVGIDQTTPGTTNGVVVNSSALPTGAASATNQNSEITALNTLNTSTVSRSTWAVDTTLSATLATGTTTGGVVRTNGGNPSPYTRFRVNARADQAVVLIILGSDDGFSTFDEVYRQTMTANATIQAQVPLFYTAYRATIQNTTGSSSAVKVRTSFTTN